MIKRIKSFLSDIKQFNNLYDNIIIITHGGILNAVNKIANPDDGNRQI
jgi:broad specificity phosphatase PhoE